MKKKQNTTTFVLIGHTGSGKSETGNTLAGTPGLFSTSSRINSETSETTAKTCRWFGDPDEEKVTIIDTPGIGDSEGNDH